MDVKESVGLDFNVSQPEIFRPTPDFRCKRFSPWVVSSPAVRASGELHNWETGGFTQENPWDPMGKCIGKRWKTIGKWRRTLW